MGDRILHWAKNSKVDIAWVAFIMLNLLAMRLFAQWQTVPFLVIWISLTALYGFRLWHFGSAIFTAATLTLATGGLIGWQVLRGKQDADYLAEVPLIAMMFVVMVWHSRRRMAAMEEMRRVSDHNLRLLEQQRQFLQNASHELRTPLTIALGHAELIERAATDQAIAKDAKVAVTELLRMRRLTSRILLLASAESPEFLSQGPVDVQHFMLETFDRWAHVSRHWSLGALPDATMYADADRLTLAIDALIENAIDHTPADGTIGLSGRCKPGMVMLAVSDSGAGIAPSDIGRIFSRFSRVDHDRNQKLGGCGLGLAIVQAIAQAHGGAVNVRSTLGQGSVFELSIPATQSAPLADQPTDVRVRSG
ncbi:MAG: HAMP domain-containing histidine kinase [Actinobacteria bacterium]|nr:HAMP domain-containing histidine kinase [Actinomycetota bacterium]